MSDVVQIEAASVRPGPEADNWRDDTVVLTMLNSEGIEVRFELSVVATSMLALTIMPCVATLKARAGDDLKPWLDE